MLENLVNYLVSHGEKEQAISLLDTMGKHAWKFDEYDDLAKCFFKQKIYSFWNIQFSFYVFIIF